MGNNLLSRRSVISGLAAMPAIPAFAAQADGQQLQLLIARYREAQRAYVDADSRKGQPSRSGHISPAYSRYFAARVERDVAAHDLLAAVAEGRS